jgi:mono/diheme cytochrome c family protein
MTRSLLRPVRTRRIVRHAAPPPGKPDSTITNVSPGTRRTLAAIGALWVSFATTASANQVAQSDSQAFAAQTTVEATLARGRYIVENVGLCADCHTPRTEKGEFDRGRWLLGSALPFQPTVPMPWAPVAPPVSGLPSMTEAQGVVFLTTGKRPDGSLPRPPMPEFRLNAADASAVVAYLKSLSR